MVRVGDIIRVKVSGFSTYGIFITYKEYTGLIHVSEISKNYVKDVKKYASLGEILYTKVLDIDYINKKLKLSLKAIYKDDTNYAGDYMERGRGFLPLKEALPKFIKEYYKEKKWNIIIKR